MKDPCHLIQKWLEGIELSLGYLLIVFTPILKFSWDNLDLGLKVMVGPSKKAPGMGLFVAAIDRTVYVEEGSTLCQCSNGNFFNDFDIKEDKVCLCTPLQSQSRRLF